MDSPPLYEFGPFTVQPAERLVLRGERAVSLTPKAFDLLIQLVDRPGQLVGKHELMAALWPDTFVEEANLAYTMSALRKALGDGQSGEQYIQTVPTRGYRFVAPVTRREPASGASEGTAPAHTTVPQRVPVMLLTAAAAVGVLAGLVVVRWLPSRNAPPPAPVRVSAELGVDATLPLTDAPFALSADGTLLAFAARTRERDSQLYVRRLDQLTATALAGTDGADNPFFSPDGRWLGFFADSKLKKVLVTGGAVVTLADAPNPRGGWWAEDDTIVFSPTYRVGLRRVSANAGPSQPETTLVSGEISHRFPQVLPGGHALLYTASTEVNIGTGASLVVQPLPRGERIVVHSGGFFARYTPSGHIVYVQDDALFAIPFDGQRLEATGPPRRVVEGVTSNGSRGSASFAVSQTGILAYVPGKNLFGPHPITWMDRNGMLSPLDPNPSDWSNPEFSPDGDRLAIDIRRDGHKDIWVHELATGAMVRVTDDLTNEEHPVWTRDGKHIVYRSFASSRKPAGHTLSIARATGIGDAQVLIESNRALIPGSSHPTQNVLAYAAETSTTDADIMLLPVEGDETGGWKIGQPTPFVNTPAREWSPMFSPDGRWLAYGSEEAGRISPPSGDVYVVPFPGGGEKVTVSTAGGERPTWSRLRDELIFTTLARDRRRVLMVSPYRVVNHAFRPDKPRPWSARRVPLRILAGQKDYALHPDGMRVAIADIGESEGLGQTHLTLVFNFLEELRRVAPPKP